jgi:hypothetical protein
MYEQLIPALQTKIEEKVEKAWERHKDKLITKLQ